MHRSSPRDNFFLTNNAITRFIQAIQSELVNFWSTRSSFTMEKVGVDMDPVAVYPDLEGLYKDYEITSDIPIIVKDEYTRKDLTVHIKRLKIKAPDIYTVKEVKGLEYSEVIVIDKDMTDILKK